MARVRSVFVERGSSLLSQSEQSQVASWLFVSLLSLSQSIRFVLWQKETSAIDG